MALTRVLFASQNVGKQRELQAILGDLGIELVLPGDVGLADLDVEETGTTFAANAELKAQAFARESGLPAIADDSGLEVMALHGEPGVYSKRFGKDDAERITKLLRALEGKNDRRAQFRSVLCFRHPDLDITHCEEGVVTGVISQAAQGETGFGYDPIFVPEGYTTTFAELGPEIKNTISHRGRAAARLRAWLQLQPSLIT